MEKALNGGLMGPITLESGNSTKLPEKALYTMRMVISMKESGKMTSQMGLENTSTLMVSFTRDSGKTTNSMAEESRFGPTDKNMKANSTRASNQARESLDSTTDLITKGSSITTKFMAKVIFVLFQESTTGFKTENTSDSGRTIRCMERVVWNGRTEKSMKATMRMTKNMDSAPLAGLTGGNT